MTISTLVESCAPNNRTDADFRAWAQVVHNMMENAGLVQTADTGQINLTTVTKPTANNGVGGYEIWRFDDALQATAPIFIRLEYGTSYYNASGAQAPQVTHIIGTGTNGAGTITGELVSSSRSGSTSSTSNDSTSSYPCYGSGDGSFVAMVMWPGWTESKYAFHGFLVERSRDADGVPTGDGIAYQAWGYVESPKCVVTDFATASQTTYISYAGPLAPIQSMAGTSSLTAASLSKDGATAPALLMPRVGARINPWVSPAICVVFAADQPTVGNPISVALPGEPDAVFRGFGAGGAALYNAGIMGYASFMPCLRWAV